MTLTLKEVEHIARLARLELSAAEKRTYQEQLSAVLEYIARLQEVDTSGIPPTSGVQPSQSPLRPDTVERGLSRQALLANAPEVYAGQFRIPPVFPSPGEKRNAEE